MLGCQIRLERQMRHSQNGVHGGADFVAHVGQKIPFCPGGGFRFVTGLDEFGFHPLEMNDIGNHGEGTGFYPVFVVKRGCMEETRRFGAIRPAESNFIDAVFTPGPALELLFHDRQILGIQELKHRSAKHIFLRPSENYAHGVVYGQGNRIVVHPPEPFVGCGQNLLKTVFALLQRIFGYLAQGDVAEYHHGTDDLIAFTLGHAGVGSIEIRSVLAPENLISSKCGDAHGIGKIDGAFLLQMRSTIGI